LVSKIQQLIPYINSYAKDHEGDLPDELSLLEDYGLDGYELFGGPVWWHKVPYRGKGKNRNLADPSRIIVAEGVVYKRCQFYHWPILFLDGHIETRTKLNRQDFDVGLTEIAKKPVWSEGKAMMGTIATAIRAWVAENYIEGTWDNESLTLSDLGFMPGDLRGTYFDENNFYWDVSFDPGDLWIVSFKPGRDVLKFTILAIAPEDIRPAAVMLDQGGKWTIHETLPMKARAEYVKKMKAFTESAEELKELGLVLLIYAGDHDNEFPQRLELPQSLELSEKYYFSAWAYRNAAYMGRGKVAPGDGIQPVPLAFDKTLLKEGGGTNVLFSDGHVEFAKRLEDVGIPPDWKEEAQIAIESRFLLLPQDSQELRDFLEAEGIELPAGEWQDNSITAPAGSEEIEKFLEEKRLLGTQPSGPPAPILDPDQVEKLIRLTQVSAKSRMLTSPKVLVLDGESATTTISVMAEQPYISGYAESDSASEPEPITKYIDTGLRFEVLLKITDDEKNIKLDLDIELTSILGYVEDVYKGQYPYKLPEIEKTKIVARVTVPDGKTALLAGNKRKSDNFSNEDDSGADEITKELLILITPTIESERD
jgi:prepilin-type processing-associated H-X9-DG protein